MRNFKWFTRVRALPRGTVLGVCVVLAATVFAVLTVIDAPVWARLLGAAPGLVIGLLSEVDKHLTRERDKRDAKRKLDLAYRMLARRATEAFVDVMRVVFARHSEAARRANADGHDYFIQHADRHLAALRESIEGSATAFDAPTHEKYQHIERRLSWCVARLRDPRTGLQRLDDLLPKLRDTAELIFGLLRADGDGHAEELAMAKKSVGSARREIGALNDHPRTLAARGLAQTRLLREWQNGRFTSIVQDTDNELAVPYFMIDYVLLTANDDEHT